MGPNGAQGGWYNLEDHYANRGGKQGMTVEEMMMQDAASLKKLGLAVPQSALDGTLPPDLFSYVIEGGLPYREEEAAQLRLPGEDFQDINAMAHFILTHPQPSIKMRNWEALSRMYYGAVPYNDEPRNPELAQQIAAVVKPVAEQMSKMYHQKQQQFGDYDQYEYLKEQVIHFAQRQGWMDIVQSFEKSLDPDTRKAVLGSYAEAGQTKDIYRLLMEETDPKPLYAGLYTLYKAGLKSNDIIDAEPQKYLSILSHMNEDTSEGYYAKELANAPIWIRNKEEDEGGEWIAREQGTLTTVEKYLNPSRQAATNWLQKIAMPLIPDYMVDLFRIQRAAPKGTKVSVYHGTTSKKLANILQHGSLDPDISGTQEFKSYQNASPGIYITTSLGMSGAEMYAHHAANGLETSTHIEKGDGGDPLVLELVVPIHWIEPDPDDSRTDDEGKPNQASMEQGRIMHSIPASAIKQVMINNTTLAEHEPSGRSDLFSENQTKWLPIGIMMDTISRLVANEADLPEEYYQMVGQRPRGLSRQEPREDIEQEVANKLSAFHDTFFSFTSGTFDSALEWIYQNKGSIYGDAISGLLGFLAHMGRDDAVEVIEGNPDYSPQPGENLWSYLRRMF